LHSNDIHEPSVAADVELVENELADVTGGWSLGFGLLEDWYHNIFG
jgi:hypothetical protein